MLQRFAPAFRDKSHIIINCIRDKADNINCSRDKFHTIINCNRNSFYIVINCIRNNFHMII